MFFDFSNYHLFLSKTLQVKNIPLTSTRLYKIIVLSNFLIVKFYFIYFLSEYNVLPGLRQWWLLCRRLEDSDTGNYISHGFLFFKLKNRHIVWKENQKLLIGLYPVAALDPHRRGCQNIKPSS